MRLFSRQFEIMWQCELTNSFLPETAFMVSHWNVANGGLYYTSVVLITI